MTPAHRIAEYTVPEPNTGCLLWTGYHDRAGYGRVSFRNPSRVYLAHRFTWEALRGPLPVGIFVCHRCDTRACVNIEHLFLGTHRDNTDDMIQKGRGRGRVGRGERNGNAKMTNEEVRQMRALLALGVDRRWLATWLGVSTSTVGMVAAGLNWKAA